MALSATVAHSVSCAIPDDSADVAAGKITAAAAWNGTGAHTALLAGKADATQVDEAAAFTFTNLQATKATSLALGGATIGSNALAVTGDVTLGTSGGNTVKIGGSGEWWATSAAFFDGGTAAGPTLRAVAATATVPTIAPNRADTTTGWGAQASGNISAIVGGAENTRFVSGGPIVAPATAIPAGGSAGVGYKVSATSNFGMFFGSGAPSLSAAKGSFYLRSDGSGANDRAYINTDGGTTWTPLVTVA